MLEGESEQRGGEGPLQSFERGGVVLIGVVELDGVGNEVSGDVDDGQVRSQLHRESRSESNNCWGRDRAGEGGYKPTRLVAAHNDTAGRRGVSDGRERSRVRQRSRSGVGGGDVTDVVREWRRGRGGGGLR